MIYLTEKQASRTVRMAAALGDKWMTFKEIGMKIGEKHENLYAMVNGAFKRKGIEFFDQNYDEYSGVSNLRCNPSLAGILPDIISALKGEPSEIVTIGESIPRGKNAKSFDDGNGEEILPNNQNIKVSFDGTNFRLVAPNILVEIKNIPGGENV